MSGGLAHLDRLARRGAVFEPPPVRRKRFRALRWLGTAFLFLLGLFAIVALGVTL